MTTPQNTSNTTYLILGGARSGKSGYAEEIAKRHSKESPLRVTYIATATPFDEEMKKRIAHHQEIRPNHWGNIEEPLYLAEVLEKNSSEDNVILVDCLTLWINNLLMKEDPELLKNEIEKFLNCLEKLRGTIIFVSNEVGMGVIPMGSITRQFVDESGRLHQRLAQRLDHVLLMVAGIATTVKGTKPF